MHRTAAAFVMATCLLFGTAAAARCESDQAILPSSGFARLELNGTILPAQNGGVSDPDGTGHERTIRALTDDEVAFLMRDSIDPRWNDRPDREDVADRDSFAMAAALGSALQRLAGFWGPRLASVLLWLFVLVFMARRPRATHANDRR